MNLHRLPDLPAGFAALRQAAETEGFNFLDRLAEHWRSDAYRDDERATLWVVESDGAMIAVGAQTYDEYDPSPLHRRIRHFYVSPAFRRRSVGRALAGRLIGDAFALAPRLHLRATHALSLAFWDAVGFSRVDREDRSHEMLRVGMSKPC